jgi:hypothetical protein
VAEHFGRRVPQNKVVAEKTTMPLQERQPKPKSFT